jgi:hypothetical protein
MRTWTSKRPAGLAAAVAVSVVLVATLERLVAERGAPECVAGD